MGEKLGGTDILSVIQAAQAIGKNIHLENLNEGSGVLGGRF